MNTAHAAVAVPGTDDKREATLVARAALAGIQLSRLSDGKWIAIKWRYARELYDAEVEQWLRSVGVAA